MSLRAALRCERYLRLGNELEEALPKYDKQYAKGKISRQVLSAWVLDAYQNFYRYYHATDSNAEINRLANVAHSKHMQRVPDRREVQPTKAAVPERPEVQPTTAAVPERLEVQPTTAATPERSAIQPTTAPFPQREAPSATWAWSTRNTVVLFGGFSAGAFFTVILLSLIPESAFGVSAL